MPEEIMEPTGKEPTGGGAVPESTGGGAIPESIGDGSKPIFSSDSFSFKHHDGTEWQAKNRGELVSKLRELDERLRHGGMRKSELEEERRKIAEQKKQMEQAVSSARMKEENLGRMYNKYSSWNDLLSKDPILRKKMEQLIDEHKKNGSSGSNISDIVKTALEAELKPLRSAYEEYEKDRERNRATLDMQRASKELKSVYEDFDYDSVTKALNDLKNIPDADVTRKFMEIMYFSLLGQKRAAEYERIHGKKSKTIPSLSSTPGKTIEPNIREMNEEEMDNYAIELLKGIPE